MNPLTGEESCYDASCGIPHNRQEYQKLEHQTQQDRPRRRRWHKEGGHGAGNNLRKNKTLIIGTRNKSVIRNTMSNHKHKRKPKQASHRTELVSGTRISDNQVIEHTFSQTKLTRSKSGRARNSDLCWTRLRG